MDVWFTAVFPPPRTLTTSLVRLKPQHVLKRHLTGGSRKGVTPALTFECFRSSDLLCDFMTKLLLLSVMNKVNFKSLEIKFLFLGNSSRTLHTDE